MQAEEDYKLDWMSEEEFPVRCAECKYLLNGLGQNGRCPECGIDFRRTALLWATYRSEIEKEDIGLDESLDLARIPEDRFPIHCAECGYDLTGLGDTGKCPECSASFTRRRVLWETYGPDVFAETPRIPEGCTGLAGFITLAGTSAALLALCVFSVAVWLALGGPLLPAIIVVLVTGYLTRRRRRRRRAITPPVPRVSDE